MVKVWLVILDKSRVSGGREGGAGRGGGGVGTESPAVRHKWLSVLVFVTLYPYTRVRVTVARN